jgi:hypothetical protein
MTQQLAEERPSADEAAVTAALIDLITEYSARTYTAGPVQRFAHPKQVGCVRAEFAVAAELPAELRVGLFQPGRRYPAVIRFGNNAFQSDAKKDIRGMSIKLSDIPGPSLLPDEQSQDFILISHDRLVVGTPAEFYAMQRALLAGHPLRFFLNPFDWHVRSLLTAIAARRHHASHLSIRYWSTTPYLFGPGRAVKYAVRPARPGGPALPERPTDNYLRDELIARVGREPVEFDFLIQFQTDPRRMPIEDASVVWDESLSPFIKVASLTIPIQDAADPALDRLGEELAFNPWHCLAEHRPLGGINRVRRAVYQALAEFRQSRNEKAKG